MLHTPQESVTALKYKGNIKSEFYEANGYYGRPNFMELAKRLGIVEKRSERMMDDFLSKLSRMTAFAEQSFLSDKLKASYIKHLEDKLKRIR